MTGTGKGFGAIKLGHVSLTLSLVGRRWEAALDLAPVFSGLEIWVLVHLGGAQGISSVDSGGRRSADVCLVSKLGLVLAVVQRGGWQHTVAHADRNLVHNAWWVASVLDCMVS